MKEATTVSPVVVEIGKMNWEGNIIPHKWYEHKSLRYGEGNEYGEGKVNLVAIVLLSDIIYWYRPVIECDEESGQQLPLRQKFRYEMYQKSYKDWAKKYGLSKRQCQDAVAFLKRRGIIRVRLDEVTTPTGTLGNVTFFEPIPLAIAALNVGDPLPSLSIDDTEASQKKDENPSHPPSASQPHGQRDTSPVITGEGVRLKERGGTFKRETYTENTTEITTETIIRGAAGAAPAPQTAGFQLPPRLNKPYAAMNATEIFDAVIGPAMGRLPAHDTRGEHEALARLLKACPGGRDEYTGLVEGFRDDAEARRKGWPAKFFLGCGSDRWRPRPAAAKPRYDADYYGDGDTTYMGYLLGGDKS